MVDEVIHVVIIAMGQQQRLANLLGYKVHACPQFRYEECKEHYFACHFEPYTHNQRFVWFPSQVSLCKSILSFFGLMD